MNVSVKIAFTARSDSSVIDQHVTWSVRVETVAAAWMTDLSEPASSETR
jgi:hypothetical protein